MLRPQSTGGSGSLSITHTGQTPRVLSRDSSVGFTLHCNFYGHNASDELFRDISKIKVMDVHPTLSWVVTVDEKLRCTVWDYVGRRLVLEFNPQDIKDRQHTERELGVAASQLPEFSTPPTQLGLRERPRSFSATSLDISAAVEDASASSAFKCGVAKTVRFYDAGALRWHCGDQPTKAAGSVNWILVVLENLVMMVDYQTNEVREVRPPAASLAKSKITAAEPVSGRLIALGCSDGCVRLYDWTKGAVVATCAGGHDKAITRITSVSVDADGESSAGVVRFVSASTNAAVALWALPIINGGLARDVEPMKSLPPSGGSLVSMALDSVSKELLVLTSDRRATLWDGTTSKIINTTVSARVVTSRGQRLFLAVPATSHRFPHRALLTCAVHSAVIELLVPAWSNGASASGGGTCIELVDIRSLRQGLPEKTKIYCMEVHPLQPFNVILGTNVGLFVLHIDATASMSAVAVSHPLWTQSWLTASTVEPTPGSKVGPGSDDEAEPPANVPDTPDVGAREDLVTIYTDATSLRAMTVVPGGSGNAASPTIANRNSGAGAGAGAGAAVDDGASSNRDEVSISVASDEQVCPISPAMSALQAAGASGKVAGAKSTAHAMHHASSSRSRMSGDAAKVGATGSPLWGPAELSVSGSGRHVGVVWPAIRSYAVFRVGGRADGEAGLDAKEVDSGNGVALAWTCAGEFGGNRFDRFVVMEPEFLPKVPVLPTRRKGDPPPPPPPAIPASLVLRQIEDGVAFKVLPEVPTQRPPASVFGGPLLGVVLSDNDGDGRRVRGNDGGGLLELQFYTWDPVAEGGKSSSHHHKRGSSSNSKTAAEESKDDTAAKSAVRKLPAVGARVAAPFEVRWSPSKLRVALCYADHTHVLALRTGTSGGSGGGSRHGGRRRGGNRGHIGLQLQYLCEISHQNEGLATPLWHQHSLFLATQASLMVVFPNRPARGTSPGATVVKLAQHSPSRLLTMPPRGAAAASSGSSSDDASSTALHPTPVCSRVGGCAPLGVLKGRLVTAQWMGLGVSVDTVPLHAPLVRMGMLAAAGDGARSVQWVSALPSHLHDAAARFFASQGLVGAAVRLPRVSITTALPLALLHGDMDFIRSLVHKGADVIAAADRLATREGISTPRAWDSVDAALSLQDVAWKPRAVLNRPRALHCVALFLAANRDEHDDVDEVLEELYRSCRDAGHTEAATFVAGVGSMQHDVLRSLVAARQWSLAAHMVAASPDVASGATKLTEVVQNWNHDLVAAGGLASSACGGVRVGSARGADASGSEGGGLANGHGAVASNGTAQDTQSTGFAW